jgi:hypothetical protein
MKRRLANILPRRRWQRWVLALVALLALAWLVVPRLAEPYVRGKLQAMVADKLDAELRMGGLTYLPPFGVRVREARIVARDRDSGTPVEMLKLARLDLRLAKLPFGEGPLVIERIEVQQPEVHLILTEGGMIGTHPAPPGGEPPANVPHLPPGTKLSDMFELRHLAVWGGRVVLEDRRRPGSVPMVWSELSGSSDTTPTSRSAYAFRLTADHKDVAAMSATGSFDLDALHVKVDRAQLAIATAPDQPSSALPARLQQIIRDHRVKGKLGIEATADLPLQHMATATFDAKVDVSGVSAYFPRTESTLDDVTLVLRCKTAGPDAAQSAAPASTAPVVPPVHVYLERMNVASGPARFSVSPPEGGAPMLVMDQAANRWTLNELTGSFDFGPANRSTTTRPSDHGGLIDQFDLAGELAFTARAAGPLEVAPGQEWLRAVDYEAVLRPTDLRLRPPKTPLPFEDVGGGRIELRPGIVSVEGLSGSYGGDAILVRSARIPIPDDPAELKRSFAVEEIDGRITFNRPNRPYPGGFGKVVGRLRPAGPFDIGGGSFFRVTRVPPADDGTPPEKPRNSDWFFGVSSDAGSFLLTDKLIPLDDIRGDATISPLLVDITRLECTTLGGRGTASGKIVPRRPYPVQQGRVALRDIDLAVLARTLDPDDPNDKLVGRGFLNFVFDGAFATDREEDVTPADALRGRGEFEVIRGHFWTLPVLGRVASETKRGDALTLGEAAGVFRVADRRVTFENAAVNSPALGLVGSGSIGFDKSLDLQIVAAPLGDWRDNVKRSKIPIVSDVAGEVVGGIQKLLSAATRTLLYEFRVTGTAGDPDVKTVPAPVLSDPAALLFGRMLDDRQKDRRLIDSVRNERVR